MKLAGPAAIQVDVLGSQQPVRADGGGGVGMKLTGIAGIDGHPDQGIAVLVVDPVNRPDSRTAQLDPGTRVELAVGTRLHAEVQAVAPGERERNEDEDREGGGGHRDRQTDEPGAIQALRGHPGAPKRRRLSQSGRAPSGNRLGSEGHSDGLGVGVGSPGFGVGGMQGTVGSAGGEIVVQFGAKDAGVSGACVKLVHVAGILSFAVQSELFLPRN